jgi:hypothetical protein
MSSKPSGGGFVLDVLIFGIVVVVYREQVDLLYLALYSKLYLSSLK